MKNLFKISMLMAVLTIALSGCSKKDDTNITPTPSTASYFGITKGTIVYELAGGPMTETVYFDNSGKQIRIEHNYANDYVDDEVWILDETAKKAYSLDVTAKTYQEVTVAEVQGLRTGYVFTESNYTAGGFKKSTETVAGKTCNSYYGETNGTSVLVSGWSGILFHTSINGDDILLVTSFSETIPANIFTVPSDYKLATN